MDRKESAELGEAPGSVRDVDAGADLEIEGVRIEGMSTDGATTARLFHVAEDGRRAERPVERIDELEGGWFWLDVVTPDEARAHELAERFALHRITREDLLERQVPKFEDLDRYQVFVVHALAPDPTCIRTVELDVIVGDRWVVTVHAEPVRSVDLLIERLPRDDLTLDGPFHVACRLFELVGERYLPILDAIDDQVLELEDGAVEGDPVVLPDIHALRRDVALLRRSLAPQRRMLELVARTRADGTDPAGRDLADTYRSATAERLNEVMKVLTVFSAIFLPMTLVAGIYGMNFELMPELDERWGYPFALGTMALIAIALWLYFVRRGFIGGPKLRSVLGPARAAGRVGRGLATAAALPVRVATRKLNGDVD
jgi:magnesium transporter